MELLGVVLGSKEPLSRTPKHCSVVEWMVAFFDVMRPATGCRLVGLLLLGTGQCLFDIVGDR